MRVGYLYIGTYNVYDSLFKVRYGNQTQKYMMDDVHNAISNAVAFLTYMYMYTKLSL